MESHRRPAHAVLADVVFRMIPALSIFLFENPDAFPQARHIQIQDRSERNQADDKAAVMDELLRTTEPDSAFLSLRLERIGVLIDQARDSQAIEQIDKTLTTLYGARMLSKAVRERFLGDYWFQRSRALLARGDSANAAKSLNAALESKNRAAYHVFAARNSFSLTTYDDPDEQYGKALELAIAERDSLLSGEICFEKSILALNDDDTLSAQALLRQALLFDPDHRLARERLRGLVEANKLAEFYQRGETAFRTGRWPLAIDYFQAILEVTPEYRDVREKLDISLKKMLENRHRESLRSEAEVETLVAPEAPGNLQAGLTRAGGEPDPPESLTRPQLQPEPASEFSISANLSHILTTAVIAVIPILAFGFWLMYGNASKAGILQQTRPANERDALSSDPDDSVPRYERRQLLGSGGMGEVYLAFDVLLKRDVALKIIRLAQETHVRERFLQEAMMTASLHHPNIVTIHDVVEENDDLYMVMEYIEGETLGERLCSDRHLTLHDCYRIIVDICKAVKYAHARDIVHRDLKPANIMLSSNEEVKVLDFGIARPPNAEPGLTHPSDSGIATGTPFYMSPEQINGEKLDNRTDIFSAGAVFYELLTGRKPFSLDSGSNSALVFSAILYQLPEPPSMIRPELSPDIDTMLAYMMAKRRDRRIQNMDIVIDFFGGLMS
jgi:tetratricopeptide (TPR) repeat protein